MAGSGSLLECLANEKAHLGRLTTGFEVLHIVLQHAYTRYHKLRIATLLCYLHQHDHSFRTQR